MTTHVLVSGVFIGRPSNKPGKAARRYVGNIRVKDGDVAQWWKALAFSESAQAELMRLADGDAVSVQGVLKAELYRPEGGRRAYRSPSLSMRSLHCANPGDKSRQARTATKLEIAARRQPIFHLMIGCHFDRVPPRNRPRSRAREKKRCRRICLLFAYPVCCQYDKSVIICRSGLRGFPTTLPDFQRVFPDDAACAAYLERLRWPDGFTCPKCKKLDEPYRFAKRTSVVLRCRACHVNTSLTATTVMQSSSHASIGVVLGCLSSDHANTRTIGTSVPKTARPQALSNGVPDASQTTRRSCASGA